MKKYCTVFDYLLQDLFVFPRVRMIKWSIIRSLLLSVADQVRWYDYTDIKSWCMDENICGKKKSIQNINQRSEWLVYGREKRMSILSKLAAEGLTAEMFIDTH